MTDKSAAAVRELAEKWYDPAVGSFDDIVSDLTALIEEHYYPKEFTGWLFTQKYWSWRADTKDWFSLEDDLCANSESIMTTDELFNYWKENEQ